RQGGFHFRAKPALDGVLSSQLLLELLPHREIPCDFLHTFVGSSVEVQLVRQLVMRAAVSENPVLVLGDTGTGKEVIARSIHKYSGRAPEKFVPVNCAQFQVNCWSQNCSVTNGTRSPTRSLIRKACGRSPETARSSWMRLAIWRQSTR